MGGSDDCSEPQHKPHRVHKTGKKALKQAKKVERYNPKAFTFSGGSLSVQRKAQRSLNLQTKREKANLLPDKLSACESPPPLIVVVQGPPKSGKSTLIRSLVKHYVKQTPSHVKGTITVTSGKTRRLTFVECSNDIHNMIDLAKIADLVLLTIDASYGFELPTFEFINILQVHGFPKLMGILTHLDKLPDASAVRRRKKDLKKRFWAELYDGVKLFYLSGLQHGKYNKTEIRNLSRFISVQKFPILSFRNDRPYLLPLRHEDHTLETEKKEFLKKVHFYGYLRGSTVRKGIYVHIPGVGDFPISSIEEYTDPCPLPETSTVKKNDAGKKLRTLKMNERCVYAPYSNLGNFQYDADAIYIDLPDHAIGFTRNSEKIADSESSGDASDNSEHSDSSQPMSDEEKNDSDNGKSSDESNLPEAVRLMRKLQDADQLLDRNIEKLELPFMQNSGFVASNIKMSEVKNLLSIDSYLHNEDIESSIIQNASSQDQLVNSTSDLYPETNMRQVLDFIPESVEKQLFNSIYHPEKTPQTTSVPGILKVPQSSNRETVKYLFEEDADDAAFSGNTSPTLLGNLNFNNAYETSGLRADVVFFEKYCRQEEQERIKSQYFITGGWSGNDIETEDEEEDHKERGPGKDRDDMKTTSKPGLSTIQAEIQAQRDHMQQKIANERTCLQEARDIIKNQEDAGIVGKYVRIVIENIPAEWYNHIKSTGKQLIVGGLLPGETDEPHLVQARIKKHRWAPRILKSNDPILLSVGWRQYQSLPLYCIEDRTTDNRIRMLKYTLEHCHCLMTFYGPTAPPGSGILGIRIWNSDLKDYRISFTGTALETSGDIRIVKKLKLVGEPYKILKNTAFIYKMFNSSLEVAKCIGAKIQTVSGIRGQIKKPYKDDGIFRATFEDRIFMSDLVICKTWVSVEPFKFCNFVLDIPDWRRLKTLPEIREELHLPAPDAKATDYGPKPVRLPKKFNPVKIPSKLQRELPFKSRPKNTAPKEKESELKFSTMTDYEKKVATFLNRLHLITNESTKATKIKTQEFLKKKKKQLENEERKRAFATKETRKRKYIEHGKKQGILRKRLKLDS